MTDVAITRFVILDDKIIDFFFNCDPDVLAFKIFRSCESYTPMGHTKQNTHKLYGPYEASK